MDASVVEGVEFEDVALDSAIYTLKSAKGMIFDFTMPVTADMVPAGHHGNL